MSVLACFRSKAGVLLTLLCVLGLALRLYHLEEKSLWSDEICTIASALGNSVDPKAWSALGKSFDPAAPQAAAGYLAKATTSHGLFAFGDTVRVLAQNIHPPFFFWMMNPVLVLFGTSPVALRILPVAFGVACIPMLYLVGRRLDGHRLGLLAAVLMTVAGYQIAHAQDARQYTFLTFLALTSAWLMLRLTQERLSPKAQCFHWVGFVLLSVIGLYTQYFYGLFLVFLVLYGALYKRQELGFLKSLGVACVSIGLGFLPWLPVFRQQLAFLHAEGHYTTGLWKPIQLPEILLRTLSDFVFPQEAVGRILIGVLLGFAIVSFSLRTNTKNNPVIPAGAGIQSLRSSWIPACAGMTQRPLGFLLLWLGVILGGQILLDIVKHSHTLSIRRYTLLSAPGFYLLLSYAMLHLKPVFPYCRQMLISLLLGLMVLNTSQVLAGKKLKSDDYRSAAMWINQQYQLGDVVLVHKTGAIAVGMAYYLAPKTPMLGLSTAENLPVSQQAFPRVWMVYSHSGKGMQDRVEERLHQQGFSQKAFQKFPGVQVLCYELAPGGPHPHP